MNIGSIVALIQADPKIPDDIPGFVKAMNAATISVQLTQEVVTQQASFGLISIADRNGGPCTPEDVQAAMDYIAALPLLDQAKVNYDSIVAAIKTGDSAVIDAAVQDADAAFAQVKAAQQVITPPVQEPPV